jgi:hypothetical protein
MEIFRMIGHMIGLSRRRIALPILVLLAVVAFAVRSAQASPMNVGPDKVAIKGYDPVAYFTEGKATKGKPAFEFVWQDAKWRFASAANRDLFQSDPEKYSPRYGGFCALGIAKGAKFDIDPNAWSIVGGRLYLNYDRGARDEWRKEADVNIRDADEKWRTTN